jgi:hypothetical protein
MGGDRSAGALPRGLELQHERAGQSFGEVGGQSKGHAKAPDECAVRKLHLPDRLKRQDCDALDHAAIFSPE